MSRSTLPMRYHASVLQRDQRAPGRCFGSNRPTIATEVGRQMTDETGTQRTKAQQIADDLKAAIERGEYAPGARLPGENALATQYGVASLTARRALKILSTEGLIETKRGAGARVISFRPIRRHGIQRLARE